MHLIVLSTDILASVLPRTNAEIVTYHQTEFVYLLFALMVVNNIYSMVIIVSFIITSVKDFSPIWPSISGTFFTYGFLIKNKYKLDGWMCETQ